MNGIIIYGSHYGSTKRYAEELSRRTGIKAISFDKIKDVNSFDTIVYLGGIYAGGVYGLAKTMRKLKRAEERKILVVTVGLADPDEGENRDNILRNLRRQLPREVLEKARVFSFRGAIDYERLNPIHRTLMNLLYRAVRNRPIERQTAEDRALVETYRQKVSVVDFSCLDAVVDELGR